MALHSPNILNSLGLTGRSEELQTRLGILNQDLQDQRQLASTLTRLQVPLRGLTNWRASLEAFDGDAEQASHALQQRAAAASFLQQIDDKLYNLSRSLAAAENTPVTSEDLRADVVELDQAVLHLIGLFPGARGAGFPSIEQSSPVASSSQARPQTGTQGRPLPPLAPTDEEPAEEEQDNLPPLQPHTSASASTSPPVRRTSSGSGSTYHRVRSMDDSTMMAGTYYHPSVVADNRSPPIVPGNDYSEMESRGRSRMLVGDAIGGNPFGEPQENRLEEDEPAPTPGLFKRLTGKKSTSRKQSMK